MARPEEDEPPPLGPSVFAVTVLPDDMPGVFQLRLVDNRGDHTTIVAQVQRRWQDFVQLDQLVRSMAPKFDAPPPDAWKRSSQEKDTDEKGKGRQKQQQEYMQEYLSTAIAFPTLSLLKDLQNFIGYSDFVRQVRQQVADRQTTSVKLRHVSPSSPSLPVAVSKKSPNRRLLSSPTSDGDGGASKMDGRINKRDVTDDAKRAENKPEHSDRYFLPPEGHHMLEECFRIMDAGAAGYITPEDMKEFFMCVDAGGGDILRLGKDEACNCEHFVATVERALCNGGPTHTVEEWVDRYWLLQYRKIFMAVAGLLSWRGEATPPDFEPTHPFDKFELASLMYILTEAGLRLVSAEEVVNWVRCGRHQRGCALTMEELSALLDTLTKAVPFSEVWLALMPHHGSQQKILRITATYASVADNTVVEEIRELVIQLRRAAPTEELCVNCHRLEESLQQQAARLTESEAARENLLVHVRYLEKRLEERQEALAQLQQEYQHAQTLLDDAELRDVELSVAAEDARRDCLANAPRGEAGSSLVAASPPLLQLMPCGSVAQHAAPLMPSCSNSPPPILSICGAVTYTLPEELSLPSEWSVDVFWCDTTCGSRNKTERLVFRDADGQRSCAFLFKNNELHVMAQRKGTTSDDNDASSFRLAPRRWYRLRCFLDWREKIFSVTLVEGGGGNNAGCLKKTVPPLLSCGPFAMVDEHVRGVTVVDIFPRTVLLVSYCNFFLRYFG
ncbi:hypothetical protein C3747_15g80 [Trypanosoma cruzi]|uniref:EF-hand domain-containing protein n=2 Tax=Trypanosoma cruzi TaxID=5693 RepID=Q4D9P9_TRYCC|nr:hypothetical protein Tc00.1047053511395.80 [Trypanosoma cruzi]EAN89256.1 hypothetical protein Tc00.1047053511395.80 [Trypanosoma cruzi]PWV17952.1 hypothetical protein C3747_15g80 [Trypanosoma cruzi]RNC54940.1 hypothetical protein TcCL_ESM07620 [Trypanosoma cruzi]|eukprot:XP_811107.1 hypothetical protein [Trypanosoma cruzi strain CL Brener]